MNNKHWAVSWAMEDTKAAETAGIEKERWSNFLTEGKIIKALKDKNKESLGIIIWKSCCCLLVLSADIDCCFVHTKRAKMERRWVRDETGRANQSTTYDYKLKIKDARAYERCAW